MSRWQKFAQATGIEKRKRNLRVLDEATGKYVRRYGYKGLKQLKEKRNWLIEMKPGDDPNADPFLE